MKILLISDDLNLQKSITSFLKKQGHICEVAGRYRAAFVKINNYEYDCAVIDLKIPGGNGMSLVKFFREDNYETGIILISDIATTEAKVEGLDGGADDFLIKPFELIELYARIKAILRRKKRLFKKEFIFGGLHIYQEERSVIMDGIALNLTKKEFDILHFLARNKNRVITKERLAEHLWGDHVENVDSFDFIYAHVKNLRKKMSEKNCGDFLKTVYGIGYKFVGN